ncbi:unnamed protein product [Schistosoma mattheei]|uniref:Uncharacterized protein n=1 Tax=Schistosoma mattheei TaxID=31246 RepID=A0A183PZR2_9TREM|nr:unnamed protein product [Schistosoma mattheei]
MSFFIRSIVNRSFKIHQEVSLDPTYLSILNLNTSGELSLHSDITCEQLNSVEADVFWCTSHLLDTIQDNYTFAQPGLQNNVKMLASLIERIDTKLYQHFIQNDVEFLQFAFRWMNNLLIRELPLRCIIRLWDTYMVS